MPKTAQIETYKSPKSKPSQRFWWRIRAANGKVQADSAEGYSRRAKAKSAIKKLQEKLRFMPVVDAEK